MVRFVAPADYVSREIWDRGFLHDENGDEIPIPDNARLVMRLLQGKVLLVAKGSLWNSDPATYDGRHNTMTAAQIRRIIERSLAG
jgi:serine/threonine-protein kinase